MTQDHTPDHASTDIPYGEPPFGQEQPTAAPTGAPTDAPTDHGRRRTEEFKVSGENLLGKVRELINEGNVRRIYIKNDEGRTLLEVPLNAGLAVTAVAAVFAPVLVAVGAIAAMMTSVTVAVVRGVDKPVADDVASHDSVI